MPLPSLDQYIQRLQQITGVMLQHVTPDGRSLADYLSINQSVAYELVIDQLNVPGEVDLMPVRLQVWGRYVAVAQRSLDLVERQYRVWRDTFQLAELEQHENNKMPEKGRAPSKDKLEMLYRTDPSYETWNVRVETAREVLATVKFIYDAFQTKAQLLTAYTPMYREAAGLRR